MRTTVFLLCFLCALFSKAQERNGIANSNYAGVNGVMLNPASMVDSWAYIDIHLVGASAQVTNDYIFLPKNEFNFFRAVRLQEPVPFPQDRFRGKTKEAYAQISVTGPSATISLEKHAIGFHTAQRNYVNFKNIPLAQAKFTFEGLTYLPQHGQTFQGENIAVKTMSWAEVGVSYSTILNQGFHDLWTGGITVKRLYGINHIGFSIDEYEYNVLDTSNVSFLNFNMEYGLTEPGWKIGKGWGFDLGVQYKKTLEPAFKYKPHARSSNCEHLDYKYKAGLSLLDVGRIRFTEQSIYNQVEAGVGDWRGYDSSNVNTVIEVDTLFENAFVNTSPADEFKAKLPTAISAQFDYNFENNLFVSATWTQAFGRIRTLGVQRASVLSVVPRYETKRFEFALPISLYDYRYPMVGFMLRLNSIIIGVDNFAPYFLNVNVSNADIYFHLKYTIFKSNKCKIKKAGSHRKKLRQLKKDGRSCPKFNMNTP